MYVLLLFVQVSFYGRGGGELCCDSYFIFPAFSFVRVKTGIDNWSPRYKNVTFLHKNKDQQFSSFSYCLRVTFSMVSPRFHVDHCNGTETSIKHSPLYHII